MQRELALLRETITKQNEEITPFERKVDHLDSNIIVLESQLALGNHVTDVWCIDDNVFNKSIFNFIQRFECYTTLNLILL